VSDGGLHGGPSNNPEDNAGGDDEGDDPSPEPLLSAHGAEALDHPWSGPKFTIPREFIKPCQRLRDTGHRFTDQ
jgi:hypothetical protein